VTDPGVPRPERSASAACVASSSMCATECTLTASAVTSQIEN
jgi:hypothetical protein